MFGAQGRNLFCVHSKKHINDVPELRAEKQAMNRRTLKNMSAALNEGGQLLWIAPSGGRDRSVDPETDENIPDRSARAALLQRILLRAELGMLHERSSTEGGCSDEGGGRLRGCYARSLGLGVRTTKRKTQKPTRHPSARQLWACGRERMQCVDTPMGN